MQGGSDEQIRGLYEEKNSASPLVCKITIERIGNISSRCSEIDESPGPIRRD